MDRIKEQGLLQKPVVNHINSQVESLYGLGPLRLRDNSLKTVQAYINRVNLKHNVEMVKKKCAAAVKFCAVVKADAYGHNARLLVPVLANGYADYFAVSNIEEAERIYPFAKGKPILVFAPLYEGITPDLIQLAQARGFHCTICSPSGLQYVSHYVESSHRPLSIQMKVDTGMGRVGCVADEFGGLFHKIWEKKWFQITGIYSHFANADDEDLSKARQQARVFSEMLLRAGIQELSILKHVSNTAGALRLPEAHFDMIRCGIGMYGYTTGMNDRSCDLKPIMKVEAPLIQIKKLAAGHSCGYGGTYVAPKDMLIGLIPFGYADGLFRSLSNRISLKVGPYEAPVVGRISMDLTMIDISGVPNPTEGMMVTVIDDQPGSCCDIYHMAEQIGTIPYEILISIGSRVKRVIVN